MLVTLVVLKTREKTMSDDRNLILADVIVKTWQDPQYKARLFAEPKTVLQQAGIDNIPEELELQVVENTSQRQYFVLLPEFSTNDHNELMTFIQNSLPLQPGKEIVLVQNTEKLQYIVLPTPPIYNSETTDALSEEELESVSGGKKAVVNNVALVNNMAAVFTVSFAVLKTRVQIKS